MLQLWYRAAVAWIQYLAQELPYTARGGQERKKEKREKKKINYRFPMYYLIGLHSNEKNVLRDLSNRASFI